MKAQNIIAILVFIGLVIWVTTWGQGRRDQVREIIYATFSPAISVGSGIRGALGAMGAEGETPEAAVEKLRQLEEELGRLRIMNQDRDRLAEENDRLREKLDYDQRSPLELVAARVQARTTANWWSFLVLDRGLKHGVTRDNPVITPHGVVGRTADVMDNRSTVVLLTDERCRVAARVEGTPERGILMGRRADLTLERPTLRLRFLTKGASIPIGTRVVSGGGGVFPPGFVLGYIDSVRDMEIYAEADVVPAVDFGSLEDVFIVRMRDLEQPAGAP